MTVRRKQSEVIEMPPGETAQALKALLNRGQADYDYLLTFTAPDEREFKAVIRPHLRFLLSTPLQIRLEPAGSKTQVVVEAQSQWFLFGDISDFYGGYLRDLFDSLRNGGMMPEDRQAERKKQNQAKIQKSMAFGSMLGAVGALTAWLVLELMRTWGK